MYKLNGIHNRVKSHKVRVKSRYCVLGRSVILIPLNSWKVLDSAGGSDIIFNNILGKQDY
jgi:hypothetical protein